MYLNVKNVLLIIPYNRIEIESDDECEKRAASKHERNHIYHICDTCMNPFVYMLIQLYYYCLKVQSLGM